MRIRDAFFAVCVVSTLIVTAAPAGAQDSGAVVGASVGATAMNSRTELTFSGTAGYRFNRYVGLEVEITAVPTLKSAFPRGEVSILAGSFVPASLAADITALGLSPLIYPPPTYGNFGGRAVMFTNNVRVEMPMASGPLTPFFVAGGGVASVRHSADYTFPIGIVPLVVNGGVPVPASIRTTTQRISMSEVDLALTIGGGVSVRLGSHASIDGDLRFFRLMGDTDDNVGRFSVGVRYRF